MKVQMAVSSTKAEDGGLLVALSTTVPLRSEIANCKLEFKTEQTVHCCPNT